MRAYNYRIFCQERDVSSAGSAVTEVDLAASDEKQIEQDGFVWHKNWIPIAVARDLDPRVPEPVTILGRPLVVWWDRNGDCWRVFEDMCPHRLAPLSEGRIHESGDLQCSYHGWTFNGHGGCTGIPQAPKDGPPVASSPRACSRVFPTRLHQGMVWVFPDPSPTAQAEADSCPIPTVPELDDPEFSHDIVQSDVQYGYEMLVENLVDPAHVPFAHHKIMGNRKNGKPLNLSVTRVSAGGVEGLGDRGTPFRFIAPCLISQEIVVSKPKPAASAAPSASDAQTAKAMADKSLKDKIKKFVLLFYCIPTSPGRSRLIFAFPQNFIPKAFNLLPRWFRHLDQMAVIDSDHYFLHAAERRLTAEGGSFSIGRLYYAPTASDAFVLAFRRWLNTFAGTRPGWGPLISPELPPSPSKEDILSRYNSHVRICKSCRNALQGFQVLQKALVAASYLSLLSLLLLAAGALAKLLPRPSSPVLSFSLAVVSAVAAVAAAWLGHFIHTTYIYKGYNHALVD